MATAAVVFNEYSKDLRLNVSELMRSMLRETRVLSRLQKLEIVRLLA